MTYVSKKAWLLYPQWLERRDKGYAYVLHRKRSDGRLKRLTSCDDIRAWATDNYLQYQYLLKLMSEKEGLDILHEAVTTLDNIEYIIKCEDLNERMTKSLEQECRAANKMLKPCQSKESYDNRLSKVKSRKIDCLCADDSPHCQEMTEEVKNLQRRLSEIKRNREKLDKELHKLKISHNLSDSPVTELYNRADRERIKTLCKKLEKKSNERTEAINKMLKAVETLKTTTTTITVMDSPYGSLPSNYTRKNGKKKSLPCSAPANSSRYRGYDVNDDCGFSWTKGPPTDEDWCGPGLPCEVDPPNTSTYTKQSSLKLRGTKESKGKGSHCAKGCSGCRKRNLQIDKRRPSTGSGKLSVGSKIRSKSENYIHETLQSYESRIKSFKNLEERIKELKKKAATAAHYKKKWLKGRGEETNMQEMWKKNIKTLECEIDCLRSERNELKANAEQIREENQKLKNDVERLEWESKSQLKKIKNQVCVEEEKSQLKEEVKNLQNKVAEYQSKYHSQKEIIQKLKDSSCDQKEEICRLKNQILRLSKVTSEPSELPRSKSKYPKSRCQIDPNDSTFSDVRKTFRSMNSFEEDKFNCSSFADALRSRDPCERRAHSSGYR